MNFYLDAWKKYATFGGRSRRKEFWFFALVNAAISYVLSLIAAKFGFPIGLISWAFSLAIFVPGIAVAIRRMHDIGKSGWWVCINFVPLVGSIWFLVLAATDSQAGDNQLGECPK